MALPRKRWDPPFTRAFAPHLSLRFQDDPWRWNADRIPGFSFDEFQRELIVENTRAGLAAARKRGRRGGRPPVLDKEGIRVAEAMLKDTMNYPFVGDVIDRLGIGRTAFYRYFPPDRIRELRNQT